MNIRQKFEQSAAQSGRHIVLSEGEDPRVLKAAVAAATKNLAKISIIGNPDIIQRIAYDLGLDTANLSIVNPQDTTFTTPLAEKLLTLQAAKGMTAEKAAVAVQKPLHLAALMVREGLADGTVGGAVYTTADTVRAALRIIGKAPKAKLVSSFFFMAFEQDWHPRKGTVVFADCGLVVAPDTNSLAEIARASAESLRALMGIEPRIAFLSFSTKGSADTPESRRIAEAAEILRDSGVSYPVDGELQFDAALLPEIAMRKAPESRVAGHANVFIFPDLSSGNIAYKIAERIGGATALGPILQGLAKPANDLSRGASAQDIETMIAITALQAKAKTIE